MKKITLFILALGLGAISLTSCVSQQDYDTVKSSLEAAGKELETKTQELAKVQESEAAAIAARDEALEQLQSAQEDLAAVQAEAEEAKKALTSVQEELDASVSELATVKAELDDTKEALTQTTASLAEAEENAGFLKTSLEELQVQYDRYRDSIEGNRLVITDTVIEKEAPVSLLDEDVPTLLDNAQRSLTVMAEEGEAAAAASREVSQVAVKNATDLLVVGTSRIGLDFEQAGLLVEGVERGADFNVDSFLKE